MIRRLRRQLLRYFQPATTYELSPGSLHGLFVRRAQFARHVSCGEAQRLILRRRKHYGRNVWVCSGVIEGPEP